MATKGLKRITKQVFAQFQLEAFDHAKYRHALKRWMGNQPRFSTNVKLQDVIKTHLKTLSTNTENQSCRDASDGKHETLLVWNKTVPDTELEKFKNYIEKKHNIKFDSYWDFHKWSVESKEIFWGDTWHYFKVIASKPYDEVFQKTGPGFLDCEWFKGAKMNFAENLLKYRDNEIAITYFDTEKNLESITFAKLFETVQIYAAAFRRQGLQIGDTVGCYMSNRLEAIYAMLATLSIGAIWSGASPFYGAKAGAIVMKQIDPKFIITIDRFEFNNEDIEVLSRLPTISEGLSSLKKVIIVPTKKSTELPDIAFIKNSCFLHDFLETGKLQNGQIPDLVFEQLPAEHPIFLNFTSGTTGVPKGILHSAKVLLPNFVNHSCHINLKRGDTYMCPYGMGWTMWHFAIPVLSLGVRLFLYNGYSYQNDEELNIWNVISKHNVTFSFGVPSLIDRFQHDNVLPSPGYDMKNFKMAGLIGSPAKITNVKYMLKNVSKDMLAVSIFGSTEFMTYMTGVDLNLPSYAPETQVPALGMDLHCVDSNGQPIIGQRGELIVATPTPAGLVGFWKDDKKTLLRDTYLSKYPGVWCQHDQCLVNPETKGILMLGRSDDTIIQNGERFLPTDIYFAIDQMEELDDFICVPQKRLNGEDRAVLFVKLKKGLAFTEELKEKIEQQIENELWASLVPEAILPVNDIPYNINGKKMESVVKKIVATNEIPNIANIRNPECIEQFCDIPEILSYK